MLLITTKYYFQYILSLSNQLVLSLKLQLKLNLYTQLNDTYLDQPQLFHTQPDNIGVRLGFWRVNCHGVFGYMSLYKPRPLSSWTAHLTDSDYLTTNLTVSSGFSYGAISIYILPLYRRLKTCCCRSYEAWDI